MRGMEADGKRGESCFATRPLCRVLITASDLPPKLWVSDR